MPYPNHKAFEPNVAAKGNIIREWDALQSALNLYGTNHYCGISKEAFLNGFFLMAWNLAPDDALGGHAQPTRRDDLGLDLQFSAPLTEPVELIIFVVVDSIVRVDIDGNVMKDLLFVRQ